MKDDFNIIVDWAIRIVSLLMLIWLISALFRSSPHTINHRSVNVTFWTRASVVYILLTIFYGGWKWCEYFQQRKINKQREAFLEAGRRSMGRSAL